MAQHLRNAKQRKAMEEQYLYAKKKFQVILIPNIHWPTILTVVIAATQNALLTEQNKKEKLDMDLSCLSLQKQ